MNNRNVSRGCTQLSEAHPDDNPDMSGDPFLPQGLGPQAHQQHEEGNAIKVLVERHIRFEGELRLKEYLNSWIAERSPSTRSAGRKFNRTDRINSLGKAVICFFAAGMSTLLNTTGNQLYGRT